MKKTIAAAVLFIILGLCAGGCRELGRELAVPIAWNTEQIRWQDYEEGLARAKAQRKPVVIVLFADWCAPCREEVEHVFSDPRVVARARAFVMVHVNGDERPEIDRMYGPDGFYFPRTYFLTADGVLLRGVHVARVCSRYDFGHRDPAALLAAMGQAEKLAADPNAPPDADPLGKAFTDVHAEQLCVAKDGEKGCLACMKGRCCAEFVACAGDTGCICGTTANDAAKTALTACLAQRCEGCPGG